MTYFTAISAIKELAKKTFNQNNPHFVYASYEPYIK